MQAQTVTTGASNLIIVSTPPSLSHILIIWSGSENDQYRRTVMVSDIVNLIRVFKEIVFVTLLQ